MKTMLCFWCMKPRGTVEDDSAPDRFVPDYEPCDECEKRFNSGLVIFEVSKEPKAPNQPHMDSVSGNRYPTGNYVIFSKKDAASHFKPDFLEKMEEDGAALMEEKDFSIFKQKNTIQ